jgi:hypothetical protein
MRFGLAAAFVAAFSIFSTAASAMTYRLVEANLPMCKGQCPGVIVASGTIGQQEHLRFAQFVDENLKQGRVSRVVVIESPGGFNVGAASLGMLLRRLNMTVIVGRWTGETITTTTGLQPSVCASACVLTLAGGKTRFFTPGSRVGVHRSHTGPTVLDPVTRQQVNGTVDNTNVKAAYASFFRQMGVSQGLADVMDKTDSSSMYWLSEQEMARFKLAQNASSRRR